MDINACFSMNVWW